MKNKTVRILVWIWIMTGSIAAQEHELTLNLSQLLDRSLQNNFLLQANQKNTLVKQAELEILQTNYLPTVSAGASFSYWKFLLPNKQKLLGDGLTDMYSEVYVHQSVYDWGETRVRKSVVDDEIRLNEVVYRQIRNTIIWGVTDAYFARLKAESEIAVHQNSLEQLQSHLQYADNLYQIGKVSGVDVLKIKVQISLEQKALQKAESAALAALIKIGRLCYLDENTPFTIVNSSEPLFSEARGQQFSHDALYFKVLENHPSLLLAEQRMSLEEKQKDLYRLQNRPELFLYGLGSWNHNYIPFGDHFNYNIGLSIRYTLPYLGGSGFKSRMLQSDYRMEQLDEEKNQAFLDVKTEIDLALNSIEDLKAEIDNNETIIDLAHETLNNALVKYQSGQGNIIDVLDAQAIITETSIAYKKSTIEYLQLLARLHYLTGNDAYPF